MVLTTYSLQIICKLPWWCEELGELKYSFVRVNAFSSAWAPRNATPGLTAHFMPGMMVMGFIEAVYSHYLSAQMIAWDFLDFQWANSLRPWFLMKPWQLTLDPSVVAKIPLLGGENFLKAPNPRIVNSIRLEVPGVDLFTFRDRAAKSGSAHHEKFVWSSNESLLGEVIPEGQEVSGSYGIRPRSSRDVGGSNTAGRSPPRGSRHREEKKRHDRY